MATRTDRARMAIRRARYNLRDLHWWAIAALILGVLGVALAQTEQDMETVVAVGFLALVTAVLATRET